MAKVMVIGGGVAGMSAAHELIERGYGVEVFERNPVYVGGKARSVDAPGTNILDKSLFLPGEHGFRFFPGFYKHVTDTMKRIPVGNGRSAFDNLVSTDTMMMTQAGAQPMIMPVNFPDSLQGLTEMFQSFKTVSSELADGEIEFFVGKIWQLMTSCKARYTEEYDAISWWDFTESARMSPAYQRLLSGGLTRSLVACKAQTGSTRTCGTILLQLLYLMMDPASHDTDRVFNAPTNDAWLTPWIHYLESRGVVYHRGVQVTALHTQGGRISGISYTQDGIQHVVGSRQHSYVLATPIERAANLISEDMLQIDASLANIIRLAPNVEWMNGIQFYLNRSLDLNRGHTMYTNSNWALTSVSQIQFWPDYDLSRRGDGTVKAILSVDISNWVADGNFNGRQARDCSKDEICAEVFKQLQAELNVGGRVQLSDDMLVGYYLDEDVRPEDSPLSDAVKARLAEDTHAAFHRMSNLEPLLVNQINTWAIRPEATTAIPNLFLASDYVRTYTDLATMEGANEAARRAVNGVLAATGSDAQPCALWALHTPWPLRVLQELDALRFQNGEPWQG